MVKIRHLEYLVAIADTESFGHAAMVCNVSQPTLSQQIRALEQELGVTLLERRTAGTVPTPIGREVIGRARVILREARELKLVATRGRDQLAGTIRLGTTPTLGPYLLSPIIAELHRSSPELRLYVREGIPAHQALELSRGVIDLHLGPLPIAGEDLEIEPLFREPLLPVVASDDPLAAMAPVPIAALEGKVMLTMDRRHHLHEQISDAAARLGMTVSPDYEGTSLDSLHQMVASGMGVTLLPALYLASDVGGSRGVTVLDIGAMAFYRSIALAWRRSSTLERQYLSLARRITELSHAMLAARPNPD